MERPPVGSDAEEDVLNPSLQVLFACCQAEDGHQFRGRGDVKASFRHHAVAAQTGDHIAQGAVVDIKHPFPIDLAQGEAVFTVLEQVVVQQGADGVVS